MKNESNANLNCADSSIRFLSDGGWRSTISHLAISLSGGIIAPILLRTVFAFLGYLSIPLLIGFMLPTALLRPWLSFLASLLFATAFVGVLFLLDRPHTLAGRIPHWTSMNFWSVWTPVYIMCCGAGLVGLIANYARDRNAG